MNIAVYNNLGQARRKSMSSRRDSHKSPFKMKPVPNDIHFEEVTMLNFSSSIFLSLGRWMQRRFWSHSPTTSTSRSRNPEWSSSTEGMALCHSSPSAGILLSKIVRSVWIWMNPTWWNSREGRTLVSSSPRLLAGRNLTLGKPAHYVRLDDISWTFQIYSFWLSPRQGGRLVAVGGTRNKANASVKILKVQGGFFNWPPPKNHKF